MMTRLRSQSGTSASRRFLRRPVDVRVKLIPEPSSGERAIVHARTYDLSVSGIGLTLTRELPLGTVVMLCLRVPGRDCLLCLPAVLIRRRGFRAGLRFVQPTAEQRLMLSELCFA